MTTTTKTKAASTSTTSDIVKDAKSLKAGISTALKTYHSVGAKLHVLAVSSLFHAATYGDASCLNTLFNGLRKNDQTALKLYAKRYMVITGLEGEEPDGLPSETIQAAYDAGKIVTFTKGEFQVCKGISDGKAPKSEAAKAFVSILENRCIKPDGETDKMVFDRSSITESKTLGDADVLSAILKAIKASTKENDNRTVNTSAGVTNFVASLQDRVETEIDKLSQAA